jgi:hypothetical protein
MAMAIADVEVIFRTPSPASRLLQIKPATQ